MAIKIILPLFLTLFTNEEFLGKYYRCSVECLKVDMIYVERSTSVYGATQMERYNTGKYLIGKWCVVDDSTILLDVTIDKKKVELTYVLKKYQEMSFLVSMKENMNWPVMVHKLDSAFSNNDDLKLFGEGVWKDARREKELLDRVKDDICSELFYWKSPVKDIYIRRPQVTAQR